MNGHHLLDGKVVVITAAAGTGIGGAAVTGSCPSPATSPTKRRSKR